MRNKLFLLWLFIFSMRLISADFATEQFTDVDHSILLKIRNEERYGLLERLGTDNYFFLYEDHVVKVTPLDHNNEMMNNILEAVLLSSLFHPSIPTCTVQIYKGTHEKFLEIHLPPFQIATKADPQLLQKMSSLLDYLHKKNIVHRDIRVDNIVETKEGYFLFGLGEADIFASDPLKEISTRVNYRSPELLLGQDSFPKQNDIWSFGISILELISNDEIFYGDGQTVLRQMLMPITVPSDSDEEFKNVAFEDRLLSSPFKRMLKKLLKDDDVLHQIFQVDPKERINASSLAAHFVKTKRWPRLEAPPKSPVMSMNWEFFLRQKIFSWMYELTKNFQMPPKVIFEAMSIADQFFCSTIITSKNALVVGVFALYLAGGFYYKDFDVSFLMNEIGIKKRNSFDRILIKMLKNARFKLIFNHSLRQFQNELYNKMSAEDRDSAITILLMLELDQASFHETNEFKWEVASSIFRDQPREYFTDYVRVLCEHFRNHSIASTEGFKNIRKKLPHKRPKSMTIIRREDTGIPRSKVAEFPDDSIL